MESENLKLKKLKSEQKLKSNKDKLLNAFIDSSKNMDDKIAVLKMKNSVDKSSFISSLKKMMKGLDPKKIFIVEYINKKGNNQKKVVTNGKHSDYNSSLFNSVG